jgi:hypothetical protein
VSGSDPGAWGQSDEEAVWAALFADGRLTDPAITPGTGERVALRVPDAVVATVRPGVRPVVAEVLSRGPVVVTDRRVLSLGEPPFSAAWSAEIRGVVPEPNGCGAIVFPTDDAFRAGRRPWALLPPSLLDPEPPPRHVTLAGLLMWNRVVAAWRASRGELEDWVSETGRALRGDS